MEELSCKHSPPFNIVCPHVFNKEVSEGVAHFVGSGTTQEYLCELCARQKEFTRHYLCQACIESEDYHYWTVTGKPGIIRQPKPFTFTQRELRVESLNGQKVAALVPLPLHQTDVLAFTDTGQLLRINMLTGNAQLISSFSSEQINTSGLVSLKASENHQLIAITCCSNNHMDKPFNHGVVADLSTGEIVMTLSCGDYHTELTDFPVEFIEHEGKTLVIHATDWNRLDISNPRTGECLTQRDYDLMPEDKDRDGTFSEWSGQLIVSPDQERIATIGWVWHPLGLAYGWNVRAWLNDNVWESDVGQSKVTYDCWDYFWDSPFLWTDDKTLCIWGYSKLQTDSDIPLDSVAIYDACTNRLLKWFPGPTMDIFYFDQYLFSGSEKGDALTVWSLEEGCLLYEFPLSAKIIAYHPETREFISVREDSSLVLVHWQETVKCIRD